MILGDQSGYLRLTLVATAVRMLSVVGSHINMVCSHDLSTHWRHVLSKHLTNRMMGADGHFYTLKHVDKRIQDAETRITVDVLRVTSYCQWFMNNVIGPVANCATMTVILFREKLPASALAVMFGYVVLGGVVTKCCAPDFADNIAHTSELAGVFRTTHKRLITNAESVAMMAGGPAELHILDEKLHDICAFGMQEISNRTIFDAGNSFFLNRVPPLMTSSLRMQWSRGYGTDAQIMSEAGGTGISARGDYIQTLIAQTVSAFVSILSINENVQSLLGSTRRVTDLLLVMDEIEVSRAALQGNRMLEGDTISTAAVDLVAPDGRCLARALSFTLKPGQHLVATGPAGCGKSSLFRVRSCALPKPLFSSNLLQPSSTSLPQCQCVPHQVLSDAWQAPRGLVTLPAESQLSAAGPGGAGGGGPAVVFMSQEMLVPTRSVSLLSILTCVAKSEQPPPNGNECAILKLTSGYMYLPHTLAAATQLC